MPPTGGVEVQTGYIGNRVSGDMGNTAQQEVCCGVEGGCGVSAG